MTLLQAYDYIAVHAVVYHYAYMPHCTCNSVTPQQLSVFRVDLFCHTTASRTRSSLCCDVALSGVAGEFARR